MSTGPNSAEREFATLTGELHALEQDIAGARAASAKAHARMDVFESPEPPTPRVEGERVRLGDGSEVAIRPIEPHDATATVACSRSRRRCAKRSPVGRR
jgi:hypothetical protein